MTEAHTHIKEPDKWLELSAICNELVAAGLPPPPGGIRWLQLKAASAAFPAQKRNGRWYTRRAVLSLIVQLYAPAAGEDAP